MDDSVLAVASFPAIEPASESHVGEPFPADTSIRESAETRARRVAIARLRARVDRGWPIRDSMFDAVLAPAWRRRSHACWTPVSVALRAARLLATRRGARILDVGSGAGKFCIVGALATSGRFVGVERQEALVHDAADTAAALGASATFVHGEMAEVDWRTFDGVYLFNPFYEHLFWTRGGKGQQAARRAHFERDVARAREKLDGLRSGTRVVTYHGFGGEMPDALRFVLREERGSGDLELWERE